MSESARDAAGNPPTPGHSPNIPATARAYASVLAWLLFMVPAILGLGGDLWLKSWSFPKGVPTDPALMPYAGRHPGVDLLGHTQPPVPVIPGVLGFTTTINRGAVFGIGQGKVDWFLGFSVLALVFIVWMFATSRADQRVVHLALGLITAGALGNLFDRAVFHGVRDMLRFYVNWFPYIFNVADALLDIGVPLLIARWVFVKEEPTS
jgi:signal peptidase II